MNPVFLIARKRDGLELAPDEIAAFVKGYARGEIPDYQMSALAMAILLNGMTPEETACLTAEMLASGVTIKWPDDGIARVDKHSTGGVGDKVSVILAPLLACCGLQVPMISGRGLGATGGTLDKLESILSFRTDLSLEEIRTQTAKVGCVITGASMELAPADRKLYALRDVTATVESVPLITGSIMSKKLAEGLDALVLDVKFGSGAFMKTVDAAQTLAHSLVAVGRKMGVRISALLTDMNQPLGRMVGNALEIDESVAALEGNGPADLMELTLALGGQLMALTGKAADPETGARELAGAVDSGAGLDKLREMVAAQGGDLDAPRALAPRWTIESPRNGYVHEIDTLQLGRTIIIMGGGRRKLTDRIDPTVGLEILVRVGDSITAGQPIMQVYSRPSTQSEVQHLLEQSIRVSAEATEPLPLIVDQIG